MNEILVLASILNPISDSEVEYYPDGAMLLRGYKSDGVLQYKVYKLGERKKIECNAKARVLDHRDCVIMPGFYDMHFHWVQDDVRLMPKASLLTWLKKYTFPAEQKFANSNYAKDKAKFFFKRLTLCGTVGGACYSSIHGKVLDYAFKQVKGQFIIGNVTMTMNSPRALTQTHKKAVQLVQNAIDKYGRKYAFTPRFAIATDPQTMTVAGRLAKQNKGFIQTHLSENHDEIKTVMQLYAKIPGFEKVNSYTEVYKKCGLLGPKTIMGHGIHLMAEERSLLAKTNTTIAHCPTSNADVAQKGLGSGLFDFRQIEKAGIRWALASDIGGGPFLSMFDVMRSFVLQNRRRGIKAATVTKALYRATLAGAQILGIDKKYGNLSVGKFADFIVVKRPKQGSAPEKAEKLLEQLVLLHKNNRKEYDIMIDHVYLKGIKQ